MRRSSVNRKDLVTPKLLWTSGHRAWCGFVVPREDRLKGWGWRRATRGVSRASELPYDDPDGLWTSGPGPAQGLAGRRYSCLCFQATRYFPRQMRSEGGVWVWRHSVKDPSYTTHGCSVSLHRVAWPRAAESRPGPPGRHSTGTVCASAETTRCVVPAVVRPEPMGAWTPSRGPSYLHAEGAVNAQASSVALRGWAPRPLPHLLCRAPHSCLQGLAAPPPPTPRTLSVVRNRESSFPSGERRSLGLSHTL